VLVAAVLGMGTAEKIYGIAYPGGHSHQLILAKIGRELVARGHQFVYIQSSLDALNTNNLTGLTVLTYEAPMSVQEWADVQPKIVELDPTDGVVFIFELQEKFCKSIMSNSDVLNAVRDSRVLLADAAFSCEVLVGDYLKTPIRVDFSAIGVADPLMTVPYGVQSPLSLTPQMGTMLGSKLSFADRIKNVIFYYINTIVVISGYQHGYVNALRKQYGVEGSHARSQHNVGIVLSQSTWGLEFSHPIVPAIKVVGPILPEPTKPLPADLEAYVQSAGPEGVVVVSLGTILYLSQSIIDRLKAALVQLPYKIIWKLNMDIGEVPAHIRILPWIPQNDLLGHPQVKAFISHGGLNGVQEAAYHGVPLVGFPLFGDQFENLIRAKERGFAIIVDRDHFNPEALRDAVDEVVKNPSYKENALRVSKIVRDSRVSPTVECADWVEYAIRHDGALFNVIPNFDMAFWERYNYDVALVLLAAALIPVFIVKKMFRACCRPAKKLKEA
jgi:hypothetical protein